MQFLDQYGAPLGDSILVIGIIDQVFQFRWIGIKVEELLCAVLYQPDKFFLAIG